MVSDFRKFIFQDDALYDGIAIDIGGPGFRFNDEFDVETCEAIRARLAPGGRIVMNVTVMNDIDPLPDRIAARLAGDSMRVWIVDEQGIEDRNAIIACLPERQLNPRAALQRRDATQSGAMVDPARPAAQPRSGVRITPRVTDRGWPPRLAPAPQGTS